MTVLVETPRKVICPGFPGSQGMFAADENAVRFALNVIAADGPKHGANKIVKAVKR